MLDNMLMASSVAGDAHLMEPRRVKRLRFQSVSFRWSWCHITCTRAVDEIHRSHLCNVIDISSAKVQSLLLQLYTKLHVLSEKWFSAQARATLCVHQHFSSRHLPKYIGDLHGDVIAHRVIRIREGCADTALGSSSSSSGSYNSSVGASFSTRAGSQGT